MIIFIRVSKEVIYFILQKLLYYPKITKSKGYKKPVIESKIPLQMSSLNSNNFKTKLLKHDSNYDCFQLIA